MLAYVFFHRPAAGATGYEDKLAAFHATLEVPSASFRLAALPFGDGGPGYEDWYLVDGWAELGALEAGAVAARRRREHDLVAAASGEGWGGVWTLRRGPARPPVGVRWVREAPEEHAPAWQRSLVLGPAPEWAVEVPATADRVRVA